MDKDTNINFFQPQRPGEVMKMKRLYALGAVALIAAALFSVNMYFNNTTQNINNKNTDVKGQVFKKQLTTNEIDQVNTIAKQKFLEVMELKDTNVLKNNGYHNNIELIQNWTKDDRHTYVYKKGIKIISITIENKQLEQLQPKNCNVNNHLEIQYCEYEIPYTKVTKIYNKNKNESGSFNIILSKGNTNNMDYKIQSFIMKEKK